MEIKFKADKAFRYTDEEGNIILSFKVSGYERRLAEMAAEQTKAMAAISVTVKELKSQRSLEQNAMLWALLTRLAEATAGQKDPETINKLYCHTLVQANVKSIFILAPKGAEESLKKVYRGVMAIGEREITNAATGKETKGVVFQCFEGSSRFNTKEMTELIEIVLDECSQFGIYDEITERARYETQVRKGD